MNNNSNNIQANTMLCKLLQEEEEYDPCHPKHLPPLCCNRFKDYYEWIKECKEYDEKKKECILQKPTE